MTLRARLRRARDRWAAKSLRFRLTALMVAVFVVLSTLASVTTAVLIRNVYATNLDGQLTTLGSGVKESIDRNRSPLPQGRWALSAQSLWIGDFTRTPTASGAEPVLPEPLPAVPFHLTVQAADGASGPYRVFGEPTGRGSIVVVASNISGFRHAASVMVIVITVDALAAALVMVLLGSYLVRRELRPLAQVAEQADALAASAQTAPPARLAVPEHPGSTEIGRMVGALDGMLAQLRTAHAEREASQDRLRQFAADASHELRTPLQSIRGYAELRQAGIMRDGEEVDQAMARIADEVRRMTGLVESLLALARFDAGQEKDTYRERVDLGSLVAAACRDAAAVQPTRPIHLHTADGVEVEGNPDQLARLLANLLGNVRMHTPADTPVDVTLQPRDGAAELTVRDHGPGIPEAALPHVFDRFYRVDRGRSRSAGGTGLGLAIVAATVAAHHGTVALVAPADGGSGLEVSVRLPLAPRVGFSRESHPRRPTC